MKFVLLMRHGIAEPRGEKPDEQRGLTPKGRDRLRTIAPAITKIFPAPDAVFTSPLTRCVQTAKYLEKAYHLGASERVDVLRPGTDIRALCGFIADLDLRHVIFVGHEPSLSSAMLALTKLKSDAEMELKRAGVYGIRFDDNGAARLEWMLAPRVLRRA